MNEPLLTYAAGVVLGFLAMYAFNTLHQRLRDLEAWRLKATETYVTEEKHDRALDALTLVVTEVRHDVKKLLGESLR